jgi:hypothetical protein
MAQIVFVLVGWLAVGVVVSLLLGPLLARSSAPAPAHATALPHARSVARSSPVSATGRAPRFANVVPIAEARRRRSLTGVGGR